MKNNVFIQDNKTLETHHDSNNTGVLTVSKQDLHALLADENFVADHMELTLDQKMFEIQELPIKLYNIIIGKVRVRINLPTHHRSHKKTLQVYDMHLYNTYGANEYQTIRKNVLHLLRSHIGDETETACVDDVLEEVTIDHIQDYSSDEIYRELSPLGACIVPFFGKKFYIDRVFELPDSLHGRGIDFTTLTGEKFRKVLLLKDGLILTYNTPNAIAGSCMGFYKLDKERSVQRFYLVDFGL